MNSVRAQISKRVNIAFQELEKIKGIFAVIHGDYTLRTYMGTHSSVRPHAIIVSNNSRYELTIFDCGDRYAYNAIWRDEDHDIIGERYIEKFKLDEDLTWELFHDTSYLAAEGLPDWMDEL